MTLTDAARTIDRLVADLARATGRDEKIVRLSYGLDADRLEGLMDAAVAELPATDCPASVPQVLDDAEGRAA